MPQDVDCVMSQLLPYESAAAAVNVRTEPAWAEFIVLMTIFVDEAGLTLNVAVSEYPR